MKRKYFSIKNLSDAYGLSLSNLDPFKKDLLINELLIQCLPDSPEPLLPPNTHSEVQGLKYESNRPIELIYQEVNDKKIYEPELKKFPNIKTIEFLALMEENLFANNLKPMWLSLTFDSGEKEFYFIYQSAGFLNLLKIFSDLLPSKQDAIVEKSFLPESKYGTVSQKPVSKQLLSQYVSIQEKISTLSDSDSESDLDKIDPYSESHEVRNDDSDETLDIVKRLTLSSMD